jgi:acyl-coenzyme A thioesterase PaaI-like protein
VTDTPHPHWREPEGAVSPRRADLRRAASAVRRVIEKLVGTSAPEESVRAAADALVAVADQFDSYPSAESWMRPWDGDFAESANAGDPHAFFDHSPLIGKANPLAPPIELEVRDGKVHGRARYGAAYEGPPGCVHGGHIAAAFDEVLGMTQSLGGQPGMTGTLTVRYRKPTPLHTDLRFEAELERVDGRKTFTTGRLYAGELLTAEAEAVFIAVDFSRLAAFRADPPAT